MPEPENDSPSGYDDIYDDREDDYEVTEAEPAH